MMNDKKYLKFLTFLLILFPLGVYADDFNYADKITSIVVALFLSIFHYKTIIEPIITIFDRNNNHKLLKYLLTFFRVMFIIMMVLIGYYSFGSQSFLIDFFLVFIVGAPLTIISNVFLIKNDTNKTKMAANGANVVNAGVTGTTDTSMLNVMSIVDKINKNICVNCGATLTQNDAYCPSCHKVNLGFLKNGIVPLCRNCKTAFKPNQKFCNQCGKPVNSYGFNYFHTYDETYRSQIFTPYKCEHCNNDIDDLLYECPNCGKANNKYAGPSLDLVCASCGNKLDEKQDFCPKCGISTEQSKINLLVLKKFLKSINTIAPPEMQKYYTIEGTYVNDYIDAELEKYDMKDKHFLPRKLYNRKKIFKVLLSILFIIFNMLIFFHRGIVLYLCLAIIMLILYLFTYKFTTRSYIVKEFEARPNEKMNNIMLGIKNDLVKDNSMWILVVGFALSIIIPSIIFFNPRAIYETNGNEAALRFYTLGIVNNSKAVIPEEYNGKKVTSIRGDVFANMLFLKEVVLPESIEEIRGGAFSGDISLEKINLPSKITEIKGNTFENCSSLKSIKIPDSVTRIGGHAFYGNASLNEVILTSNSNLREIGSSAFRRCYSLNVITIPNNTYVNERAFKESPTRIMRFNEVSNNYYEEELPNNYVAENADSFVKDNYYNN